MLRRNGMTPKAHLSLPYQAAFQAEFVVNNLQQTDYQHTDNIDIDRGRYDCDCNGFAAFILRRSAPDHFKMIPKEPDQSRPRAFKYHDFFAGLTPESIGGWHRIELLRDARRGDIVAWRFPQIEPHHDTGHVVILAETPFAIDSTIFSVRVYDSAVAPHFDDTRGPGEGGVGSGFLQFQVDAAGKPNAFLFGPSYEFTALPIAIGRMEPLGAA
jgi:hypothetical protein